MDWPASEEPLPLADFGMDPANSCSLGLIEVIASPSAADRADDVLRAMSDADWRIRRAAASTIPELDYELLSVPLYDLLASEDAGARNAAIKAYVRIGSPAVAHLLPGLNDSDPDVRNFCALALGLIGDRAATPHLTGAFEREADHNVQYMIVEALGRLHDPAAVPCLMQALQGIDWIRASAVDALGEMRCSEAVSALTLVLDDEFVGGVAACALGRTRDVRAVLPLAVAAGNSEGLAAEMFLSALAAILLSPGQGGSLLTHRLLPLLSNEARERLLVVVATGLSVPRTAPDALAVADWLDDTTLLHDTVYAMGDVALHDLGVRIIARQLRQIDCSRIPSLGDGAPCHSKQVFLEAVAAAGVCGDTDWIITALSDANPLVAAAAARALGVTGDESHFGDLLPLLDHPLESVRIAAADGIAGSGADTSAFSLLEAVRSGSPERRAAVARVLACRSKWSDESLMQAARMLSMDESERVRLASARIIATAPADLAASLAAVLSLDSSAVVRRVASEAVGRSHMLGSRVCLRGLAKDSDVGVRVAVLSSLAASPDASDFAVYVNALSDPDPRVKMAALDGLGSIGVPEAAVHIRHQLIEGDPDLFCAALRALAQADVFEAAAVALGAVYSEEWQVRATSVDVLRIIQGDLAREPVRRALLDEDSTVRRAAIAASPRVLGAEGISELLLMVDDEHVGSDAEDALLQVACDATVSVLERLEDAEGPQRSALLRIAASVAWDDEALFERLLVSSSSEDRFYAALGLSAASANAQWAVKQAARIEADPGVELVMTALAAAYSRTAGTPHA